MDLVDVLQPQPLRGERVPSASDARIGQHPARLLLERARRRQLALARQRQQLLIGRRAPQEERQARREVDVGDAVGLPGRASSGSFSRRKMKCGLARIASSACADAAFEPALGRALLVERHQPIDLGRRQRTPVGFAAEPRDDLPRARPLFAPASSAGS